MTEAEERRLLVSVVNRATFRVERALELLTSARSMLCAVRNTVWRERWIDVSWEVGQLEETVEMLRHKLDQM